MNNAVFVGIYAAKESRAGILPSRSASGMWQAWAMPDGKYMIQPLDYDKNPSGSLSLMGGKEFMSIFAPLEPAGENTSAAHRPNLPSQTINASAPNLLAQWYLQDFPHEDLPAEVANQMNMGDCGELRQMALRSDDHEPQLFPVNDPLFADPETASLAHGEERKNSGKARTAKPKQTKARQDALDDPLDACRSRLAALEFDEDTLRKEFYSIIDKMADGNSASAVDECAVFLQHDFGAIPGQAFLFTEFGLALRREKHLALALFSHMKALNFSPEDANILFNIARTNYDLGKFEEARKYLTRSLTIAPDFDTARNFLNFLNSSM